MIRLTTISAVFFLTLAQTGAAAETCIPRKPCPQQESYSWNLHWVPIKSTSATKLETTLRNLLSQPTAGCQVRKVKCSPVSDLVKGESYHCGLTLSGCMPAPKIGGLKREQIEQLYGDYVPAAPDYYCPKGAPFVPLSEEYINLEEPAPIPSPGQEQVAICKWESPISKQRTDHSVPAPRPQSRSAPQAD